MEEPTPAPRWTSAVWPASTSSRTPAGVSATRYSSVLSSVGTPTITGKPPRSDVGVRLTNVPPGRSRGLGLSDQLAAAQCQPELDPVARVVQAATRQRLYAANAVAKGVAVAVQPPRGALPLSVALDKRLQRTHQLAAVVAFTRFDRAKDGVAEEPKRFVVLKRQQQLERSKILVTSDRPRRTSAVVPVVT